MPFQYPQLLYPPISRAAYSDRMAWLMAELSLTAYIPFEESPEKLEELKNELKKANFELVHTFNEQGTQAFLAKRTTDNIAVLSFRGTEVNSFRDILADLNFRFYRDDKGSKIDSGFRSAFSFIEQEVIQETRNLQDYALYITGHSLGGALALMAAYSLSSNLTDKKDILAACYTFGSPRVGDSEFGDKIKMPIYRIVNADDIVPRVPFPLAVEIFYWAGFFLKNNILGFIFNVKGCYAHHGDQRYLTQDINKLRVISNPGFIDARYRWLQAWNIKLGVGNHSCSDYCAKLAKHALDRLGIK